MFFICLVNDLYAQQILTSRGEVRLLIPSDYIETKSYPLLLLLHGYGFDGEIAEEIWGFTELINEYDFIYISPSGTIDQTQSPFWNATPACCNFYNSFADDVSFLYELIEKTKTQHNVDANRVYIVGDSNGGFMALELAYQFPELITAVVNSAGASHFYPRNPLNNGVHILHIHGTKDSSILYEGGTIQGKFYPGAETLIKQWAGYNGCSSVDMSTTYKDLFSALPGLETEVMKFKTGCLLEGSAELWKIVGGGHGLGRPVSASNRAEVINWLFAKTKYGWPGKYSGVSPPNSLQIKVNNIGHYNVNDGIIYSCLRALQAGKLVSINGTQQFDIGFEISSEVEGKIRVAKSRPFNPTNALTKYNEQPDCSGTYEMTSGIYSDTILINNSVFQASFKLTNTETLELELLSITSVYN